MADFRSLRPALPMLIGASLMLSVSMGLRQSLGIFMPDLTRDLSISVSDFTLAVAVQNLAWGFLQPVAGALAVRWGYRPVMVGGTLFYIAGLAALMLAQGLVGVVIGAGVLIGISLACTASALAMAVAARSVSIALRSTVLGVVSAAGSLGAMVAAPLGQWLSQSHGWRIGVLGFVLLALVMIPAAWSAGKVDRIPLPPAGAGDTADNATMGTALKTALGNARFVVMALAYFVCGMQLVFPTTHLPSYLDLCGMDPMLSAQALGTIGGFNVLGSLFFGWAGGRWNKQALLGGIYITRSLVLAWYFVSAPTPAPLARPDRLGPQAGASARLPGPPQRLPRSPRLPTASRERPLRPATRLRPPPGRAQLSSIRRARRDCGCAVCPAGRWWYC